MTNQTNRTGGLTNIMSLNIKITERKIYRYLQTHPELSEHPYPLNKGMAVQRLVGERVDRWLEKRKERRN